MNKARVGSLVEGEYCGHIFKGRIVYNKGDGNFLYSFLVEHDTTMGSIEAEPGGDYIRNPKKQYLWLGENNFTKVINPIKDTKIARKMNPNFEVYKEGWIIV